MSQKPTCLCGQCQTCKGRVHSRTSVARAAANLCRHCHKTPANRSRGLCWQCYYTPGVRALYPSASKFASKKAQGRDDGTDMTAEEVERMVAEQYANLPDWWRQEGRRLKAGEDE